MEIVKTIPGALFSVRVPCISTNLVRFTGTAYHVLDFYESYVIITEEYVMEQLGEDDFEEIEVSEHSCLKKDHISAIQHTFDILHEKDCVVVHSLGVEWRIAFDSPEEALDLFHVIVEWNAKAY